MVRVYVSIGSNIDRERHVRGGVDALRERFGELRLSSVYESEAVGFQGDHFYNLVAAFETNEAVGPLIAELHAIEERHGRTRTGPRFSARTLDIDLLLYGDLVVDEGELHLPREEITRHAFVLEPLAELAPEMRHPLLGRSFGELWRAFDRGGQRLWAVPFSW